MILRPFPLIRVSNSSTCKVQCSLQSQEQVDFACLACQKIFQTPLPRSVSSSQYERVALDPLVKSKTCKIYDNIVKKHDLGPNPRNLIFCEMWGPAKNKTQFQQKCTPPSRTQKHVAPHKDRASNFTKCKINCSLDGEGEVKFANFCKSNTILSPFPLIRMSTSSKCKIQRPLQSQEEVNFAYWAVAQDFTPTLSLDPSRQVSMNALL